MSEAYNLIPEADYIDACNATREKTGKTALLKSAELGPAIRSIKVGEDTSDATASAGEVFAGKTAYLAGGKATGTFTIEAELAAQDTKIAALQEAVKNKAGSGGDDGLHFLIDGSVTEIENNATSIRDRGFSNCTKLTTASFPMATSIGFNAFDTCQALTTVSFPMVTDIRKEVFRDCSKLTTVSFPMAEIIGGDVFCNCYRLKELHLEGPALCKIFKDPNINSNCKIYVPANLIDQYKAASNWSKYASQFVAV